MKEYPRLQNLQRMLVLIDHVLKEAAREEFNPEVEVRILRRDRDAGVYLIYFVGDPKDFFTDAYKPVVYNLARGLGCSGGETVALFRWAESEGYIRLNYGALSRDLDSHVNLRATLEHLQSKGYELIGELPDPQERLARILDAAIQVVQRDASLDPQEKKRRIDWFEEAKFVVRTFGVEVAKSVLRGDIPPM